MGNPITRKITDWASRLRWPWLFAVTAILFVVDLIVPDVIPLADEILLGLLTLLFGAWRKRKQDRTGPPKP